jgi:hypothetical protein
MIFLITVGNLGESSNAPATSSVVVLVCPYPVSQITPKVESNQRRVVLRIRWMRVSDCSQRDAEAGLRNLVYDAY